MTPPSSLLFHARCHGRAAGCLCPDCQAIDRRLEALRAGCATCHGDAHACNERADGARCQAWTAAGKIRIIKPAAPQPWESGRTAA